MPAKVLRARNGNSCSTERYAINYYGDPATAVPEISFDISTVHVIIAG